VVGGILRQSILGNRIKSLRMKNNMTQKEVANKLNYSESTISGWETGKREPSFDDLNELAKLFNVCADIFFNGNMEEIKAYQSKNEHYFSTRLIKLYKDDRPLVLSLFLIAVLITLIAAYTYIDVVTYGAIIAWTVYLMTHFLLFFLSLRIEKTTIHYPNNETLIYEHELDENKINTFRKIHISYLIFSFIFGLLTILYSNITLSRVMSIEGAESFHLIIVVVHMMIHVILLIVDGSVGKRSKYIDYFTQAHFHRLTRFKILVVYYTFIFGFIALSLAINGPSEEAILNFSIPLFLSANVLGALIVYFFNNRFNKGYKLYAEEEKTKQKTHIGI
jgi:transcriptional regulator with XRE-family HTH domain